MGLISKYTFQGNEYQNAYYRIKSITIAVSDEDELKEMENGHSYNTVNIVKECTAHVFIYDDYDARLSNVPPINQILILYPFVEDDNIWQAAYTALKNTKYIHEHGYTDK